MTRIRIALPAAFIAVAIAAAAAPAVAQAPATAGAAVTQPRQIEGEIVGDDYPIGAIRAALTGASEVRVAIGPDGRATGCTILRSSGSPELDQRACTILAIRYRWAPAADAAGRPVASTMVYTIDWRIQTHRRSSRRETAARRAASERSAAAARARSETQPPYALTGAIVDADYPPEALRAGVQGVAVAEIAFDAAGRPTGCTIIVSAGHPPLDAKTCELLMTRFTWAPARDAQGVAVAATLRRSVTWVLPGRR